MRSKNNYDIVIIGAGPTGLTAANLLGTYGVDTLVVEKNATTQDIPRAILLDDEGARTLQAAGLDRVFMPMTKTGAGSRYYDSDGRIIRLAHGRIRAADSGHYSGNSGAVGFVVALVLHWARQGGPKWPYMRHIQG